MLEAIQHSWVHMNCQGTYGWAEVRNCEWLLEKLWTEAINDVWNFFEPAGQNKKCTFFLTYEIPGWEFLELEGADIRKAGHSFHWFNWEGIWRCDSAEWTRRWRFWHCCGDASADYQNSEERPSDGTWLHHFYGVDCRCQRFRNLSLRGRLSWQHTRQCIGMCRRRQSNQRSSLTFLSVLCATLPCTVHCLIAMDTSSQECQHSAINTNTNVFVFINHCACHFLTNFLFS